MLQKLGGGDDILPTLWFGAAAPQFLRLCMPDLLLDWKTYSKKGNRVHLVQLRTCH